MGQPSTPLSRRGTFFIVGTPIGNLNDCSFRLVDTLKNVHLIAAEDTRTIQNLLHRYSIKNKVISLEKHNEARRLTTITAILDKGLDVALVSEAGTPNIADPGSYVISEIHALGYPVVPIPGPSAPTTLLSISGLLANQFYFAGFFPRKSGDASTLLKRLKNLESPILFFESAKRLEKTLGFIDAFDPDAHLFIAKELTKIHETYWHGLIGTVREELLSANLKGEWCFAVKLSGKTDEALDLEKDILDLKEQGLSNKQIIFVFTQLFDYPKNKIYKLVAV